jgi:hypothetical protein
MRTVAEVDTTGAGAGDGVEDGDVGVLDSLQQRVAKTNASTAARAPMRQHTDCRIASQPDPDRTSAVNPLLVA